MSNLLQIYKSLLEEAASQSKLQTKYNKLIPGAYDLGIQQQSSSQEVKKIPEVINARKAFLEKLSVVQPSPGPSKTSMYDPWVRVADSGPTQGKPSVVWLNGKGATKSIAFDDLGNLINYLRLELEDSGETVEATDKERAQMQALEAFEENKKARGEAYSAKMMSHVEKEFSEKTKDELYQGKNTIEDEAYKIGEGLAGGGSMKLLYGLMKKLNLQGLGEPDSFGEIYNISKESADEFVSCFGSVCKAYEHYFGERKDSVLDYDDVAKIRNFGIASNNSGKVAIFGNGDNTLIGRASIQFSDGVDTGVVIGLEKSHMFNMISKLADIEWEGDNKALIQDTPSKMKTASNNFNSVYGKEVEKLASISNSLFIDKNGTKQINTKNKAVLKSCVKKIYEKIEGSTDLVRQMRKGEGLASYPVCTEEIMDMVNHCSTELGIDDPSDREVTLYLTVLGLQIGKNISSSLPGSVTHAAADAGIMSDGRVIRRDIFVDSDKKTIDAVNNSINKVAASIHGEDLVNACVKHMNIPSDEPEDRADVSMKLSFSDKSDIATGSLNISKFYSIEDDSTTMAITDLADTMLGVASEMGNKEEVASEISAGVRLREHIANTSRAINEIVARGGSSEVKLMIDNALAGSDKVFASNAKMVLDKSFEKLKKSVEYEKRKEAIEEIKTTVVSLVESSHVRKGTKGSKFLAISKNHLSAGASRGMFIALSTPKGETNLTSYAAYYGPSYYKALAGQEGSDLAAIKDTGSQRSTRLRDNGNTVFGLYNRYKDGRPIIAASSNKRYMTSNTINSNSNRNISESLTIEEIIRELQKLL